MRPEAEALERHLAAAAQTVTVRRRIGTSDSFIDIRVRARLSGYRAEEIANTGVKITERRFIMSAVPFSDTTWPGAAGGGRLPRIGDWILVDGVQRRIEEVAPVTVGEIVVRLEGRCN